jgi:hypothetical protein
MITENVEWNGEEWILFSDAAADESSLMAPGEQEQILRKLCAKGEVRAVCCYEDGPKFIAPRESSKGFDSELVYLSVNDLMRWVFRDRPEAGKQPRIKAHLAKLFPPEKYPEGVPDHAHCPRKTLKADLLKLDPGLSPLDEATLKSAIDAYNSSLG